MTRKLCLCQRLFDSDPSHVTKVAKVESGFSKNLDSVSERSLDEALIMGERGIVAIYIVRLYKPNVLYKFLKLVHTCTLRLRFKLGFPTCLSLSTNSFSIAVSNWAATRAFFSLLISRFSCFLDNGTISVVLVFTNFRIRIRY